MNSDLHVTIGQRQFKVRVVSTTAVEVDGKTWETDLVQLDNGRYSLRLSNQVLDLCVGRQGTNVNDGQTGRRVVLSVNGHEYTVCIDDERTLLLKSFSKQVERGGGQHVMRSPMPGMVVKIEVQQGDIVQPGQGLIVLEAMKMENELKAAVRGRVAEVFAESGTSVEKGEKLLTIESE